jgi:hypothetical protein
MKILNKNADFQGELQVLCKAKNSQMRLVGIFQISRQVLHGAPCRVSRRQVLYFGITSMN